MMTADLLLVATYAALGFDGLGHYAVAPMALHTLGANITILSEVAAAAFLLPATIYLLLRYMHNLKTKRLVFKSKPSVQNII